MYYDQDILWGISLLTNKRAKKNFGYYSTYYIDFDENSNANDLNERIDDEEM